MVKHRAFSLRSGTGLGYMPSPLLFSISQEIITRAIRKYKDIKYIKNGMNEVKLFIHRWSNFCMENPKKSTHKNLLVLINKFRRVAEYKINNYKSVVFYILPMKMKLKKQFYFQ